MKRLWEVDHPYYCNEGNYYAPGNDQPFTTFKSWQDFLAEEDDADLDMNLLFRWDWPEGNEDVPNFNGDVNYHNGKLLLFFMGQRKGLYRWVEVAVCRADEPAVIAYLTPRLQRLKDLWAPLILGEDFV